MAGKITDLSRVIPDPLNDLCEFVDVSDTTDDPAGSSKNFLPFDIAPISKRLTADFPSTTTTLATVTGLSVDVEAGIEYVYTAKLNIAPDTTGGSKWAMGGTATATEVDYSTIRDSDVSRLGTGGGPKTALDSTDAVAGTATDVQVTISGSIKVNAAGTFGVRFAQNSASGTSNVKKGSTFTIQRAT